MTDFNFENCSLDELRDIQSRISGFISDKKNERFNELAETFFSTLNLIKKEFPCSHVWASNSDASDEDGELIDFNFFDCEIDMKTLFSGI